MFVIGINIYGALSITGMGMKIHLKSRISNGINSFSINNMEVFNIYIGFKDRIFKNGI